MTLHVSEYVKNTLKVMGTDPLTASEVENQIIAGKNCTLSGFQAAVEMSFSDEGTFVEVANKLRDALNKSTLKEVPILTEDGEVVLTRGDCRDLLICGFWNMIPRLSTKDHEIGDISFMNYGIFRYRDSVGVARINCFFEYFKHVTSDEWMTNREHEILTFKRDSLKSDDICPWETSTTPISSVKLQVSSDHKIEDFNTASSHVDFANKRLQIHKNIASATQEEVLFSIKQELMLCLPLFSTLDDNDVVTVTNALQYSSYSGYLDSFTCEPLQSLQSVSTPLPDILAIDAMVTYTYNSQFEECMVNRELNKAYAGFRLGGRSVATGNWGCGAFGGDHVLKFLQQMMVAAECGTKEVLYSTFLNTKLHGILSNIHKVLVDKNTTVADLYKIITSFRGNQFDAYVLKMLSS